MDATTDISLDDLSSLKCFVSWSIGWFLGFTLVLCWSIWQLPDAQGCGIKAAWVPDAFCREACLIPFCPVVFAIPSIFWPVTLVVLVVQQIERRCGRPFTHMREAARTEKQEMQETYRLLPEMESGIAFDERGSIPLSDLSDSSESPRTSDETLSRLPYHMRATRAIRNKFSSKFRSLPYQPIPPATY